MWWAHEKSKIVEDRKIKGLTIVTGLAKNSEKLSWMNDFNPAHRYGRFQLYPTNSKQPHTSGISLPD